MKNQYISDWLTMPVMHKDLPFQKLNKKSMVIVDNHTFLGKAIKESFETVAEIKKLAININISDLEDINSNNSIKADYVIFTGCCMKQLDCSYDSYLTKIKNTITTTISQFNPDKVIFLSDYRIFDNDSSYQIKSEYEFYNSKSNDISSFMENYENICIETAKKYNISYYILRTAEIFAPFINEYCWDIDNYVPFYSFFNKLSELVSCNNKIIFSHLKQNYSFCYMGDFLSAIWYVLLKCPENSLFHVTSEKSVSLEYIMAVIYEFFPEKANIVFSNIDDFNNLFINDSLLPMSKAMNCDKLSLYGFEPLVTIKKGLSMMIQSKIDSESIYYFDNAYQGKLSSVKEILLELLLEIDRICKKHDIKYFLAGGTLLGAVRHKGFIPWDDDIDVMMLREDFDRFNEVIKNELPKNLFYQTPETESGTHYLFNKIRLNNTLLMTEFSSHFPTMHNGVFADVVVQDKTSSNKFKQKIHIFLTHELRKMTVNKWRNIPIKRDFKKHWIERRYQDFREFLKVHLSIRFLENLRNKVLTHYKNKDTGYLYDGVGRNIDRGAFPEAWLKESVELYFEGHKFPVPKEYDKYLTYLYGDYMKMVPVSMREVSHDMAVIDLGKYFNFKKENL